jgi:hypothetical protein
MDEPTRLIRNSAKPITQSNEHGSPDSSPPFSQYLGIGYGPLDAGALILWCLRKKMREKFRAVRGRRGDRRMGASTYNTPPFPGRRPRTFYVFARWS